MEEFRTTKEYVDTVMAGVMFKRSSRPQCFICYKKEGAFSFFCSIGCHICVRADVTGK